MQSNRVHHFTLSIIQLSVMEGHLSVARKAASGRTQGEREMLSEESGSNETCPAFLYWVLTLVHPFRRNSWRPYYYLNKTTVIH